MVSAHQPTELPRKLLTNLGTDLMPHSVERRQVHLLYYVGLLVQDARHRDSIVSHQGVRQHEDLVLVRRIRQRLRVPHHPSLENCNFH